MGWCSGTQLFDEVVGVLLQNMNNKSHPDKVRAVAKVIKAFRSNDWDCEADSRHNDNYIVIEAFAAANSKSFGDFGFDT